MTKNTHCNIGDSVMSALYAKDSMILLSLYHITGYSNKITLQQYFIIAHISEFRA